MNQIEAMRQALEAFEQGLGHLARDTLRVAIEQALKPGEVVALPEGWHIAKADNGQVLVSAPNCDPGYAWIKNQGPLPQRILYALVGAMLDAPQPQRDDTALLRQALEYLERSVDNYPTGQALSRSCHEDTITAIRERLK
jgi:hypothetical protein